MASRKSYGAGLHAQQGDVHFQGGQELPELVMDFQGDALALLFADGIVVGRQLAQARARLDQFLLHRLARGDGFISDW